MHMGPICMGTNAIMFLVLALQTCDLPTFNTSTIDWTEFDNTMDGKRKIFSNKKMHTFGILSVI